MAPKFGKLPPSVKGRRVRDITVLALQAIQQAFYPLLHQNWRKTQLVPHEFWIGLRTKIILRLKGLKVETLTKGAPASSEASLPMMHQAFGKTQPGVT